MSSWGCPYEVEANGQKQIVKEIDSLPVDIESDLYSVKEAQQ